jgi:hypothetical protein
LQIILDPFSFDSILFDLFLILLWNATVYSGTV